MTRLTTSFPTSIRCPSISAAPASASPISTIGYPHPPSPPAVLAYAVHPLPRRIWTSARVRCPCWLLCLLLCLPSLPCVFRLFPPSLSASLVHSTALVRSSADVYFLLVYSLHRILAPSLLVTLFLSHVPLLYVPSFALFASHVRSFCHSIVLV